MTPSPLEVGAALIYENGQYLITQRMPDDSFGGFWELPGGKKEPTESLEECVIRELREELAVEVEVKLFYKIITYHYSTRSVRLNIFLCGLKSGTPQKIEVADFAWANPGDLSKYNFPEADQTLIGELAVKDWEKEKTSKFRHEYLEGIRLFNQGAYFECHEMIEHLWMKAEGLDKVHYQALIQAAVAVHHLQNGNGPGAFGLYEKAKEKWDQLPGTYLGLNLSELKERFALFFGKVKASGASQTGKGYGGEVPVIPLPE
jgi:mutator protein MutT